MTLHAALRRARLSAGACLLALVCGCAKEEAPHPAAAPAPAASPAPAAAPPPAASPAPALVTSPAPAPAASPTAEPADGAYPGFRVAAFRAKVRRPSAAGVAQETFDSRATKKPTLYIINSAGCPACTEYAERMKAVETKYMAKGVDVVHVYPNKSETADAKIAWHKDNAFAGGQIVDDAASFARKLEAEVTPTVYLADAAGRIVYRGGIDDSMYPDEKVKHYLVDALDAFLAGRKVELDTTEPEG